MTTEEPPLPGVPRLRAAAGQQAGGQPRHDGQDRPLVAHVHVRCLVVGSREPGAVRPRARRCVGRRARSAAHAAAELPQLKRRGGVERPLGAGDVVAGGDVLLALPQRQHRDVVGDDVLDLREALGRGECGRPRGGTPGSACLLISLLRVRRAEEVVLVEERRDVVVGVGEVGEPAHAVDVVLALLLGRAERRPRARP